MKMTISYPYLDVKLDILDNLGFPKARALEVLQLKQTDLNSPEKRMNVDLFQSCLSAAADFTSDKNIGLRVGHKFRVGSFGETGKIYNFCENIEEVIAMNSLYQKIAIDVGKVSYLQKPDGSHHMCFQPYYTDYENYRLLTDMIMASYITAYKWLSWASGEDIICAHLPYVRDAELQTYSDILQTRVTGSTEGFCVQLSDIAMSQKLTTHDPERLVRARIILDKLLGEKMSSQDFADAVETAIRGAIEAGQVSSDIVANRMGLSRSALRTQLALTGEGIRPRLDKVRKSLFIEKFEAGLNFSQIAFDLAYNDQAAMNRAFRRWFDMTPSQWRLEVKKHELQDY